MPSPFPGMDPYLESPRIWRDVHHRLISEIQEVLNTALRHRYVARVELNVYISDDDDPGRSVLIPDLRLEKSPKRKTSGRPKLEPVPAVSEPLIIPTLLDEEIEEAFLRIIHVQTEQLVTVIEVLSPSNKVRGSRGRSSFMSKRHEIMNSEVHWVEIDLLRDGVPSVTDPPLRPSDYRVLVSRADQRLRTRFWPISVRQKLPVISIPLRSKGEEVSLDLGAVLRSGYDRAAYDQTIDYCKNPEPPLEGDDAKWARELLRVGGYR